MGVFYLAMMAMFAIGSFGQYLPIHLNLTKGNALYGEKKWVVLVAGSSGWSNYRHQADLCHAYRLIRENGIPKRNIITMMVDDIANNPRNPTPGKIVNRPEGINVYEGVVIDYKGKDVNSKNFLNIIRGNKEAMQSIGSGKVVEGGPHDRIFINFISHGTSGILGFPNDYLYADQLNEAFQTMYKNGMYRKMLLYVESCKAGSMFDGTLKDNIEILAVTAAGPREDSFGCYCRSQSGPYHTCLGDLFSATWMEALDETSYSAEKRTIFNDFSEIRTNVTKSNVMVYGDFDIGHEKLTAFLGLRQKGNGLPAEPMSKSDIRKMTVSNRDAHINSVQHQLAGVDSMGLEKFKLMEEIYKNKKMRLIIDKIFQKIYSKVVKAMPNISDEIGNYEEPNNLDLTLDKFPCYRSILNNITESCFSLPRNPYALDRLTIFANLCIVNKIIHQTVGNMIKQLCLNVPRNIINVF